MSKEKHNIKTAVGALENVDWNLQDAFDCVSVYSDLTNKDCSVIVNPGLKKVPINVVEMEIW